MIHDFMSGAIEHGREMCLGKRHAHTVAKALSERTSCRLNAGRQTVLGMAGGFAAELAEFFQFVERKIITGEMQEAVEQHRSVSG